MARKDYVKQDTNFDWEDFKAKSPQVDFLSPETVSIMLNAKPEPITPPVSSTTQITIK